MKLDSNSSNLLVNEDEWLIDSAKNALSIHEKQLKLRHEKYLELLTQLNGKEEKIAEIQKENKKLKEELGSIYRSRAWKFVK